MSHVTCIILQLKLFETFNCFLVLMFHVSYFVVVNVLYVGGATSIRHLPMLYFPILCLCLYIFYFYEGNKLYYDYDNYSITSV